MALLQSKSRLEAFSDGVFAFAATLLVVSLEVPDNFGELRAQMNGFWSFGLSFLGLVLLWKVHYNFFRRSNLIDNVIVAANMTLLFTVLFFVFPLKFLINLGVNGTPMLREDLADLFLMYGIGFSMIFVCVSFMYYWSYRKLKDREPTGPLQFYAGHFAIYVLTGLLASGLAFLDIGTGFGLPGFTFSILGPLCVLHSKRYQRLLPEEN